MSGWLATQADAFLSLDKAAQEAADLLVLALAVRGIDPIDALELLRQGVEVKLEGIRQEQIDRLRRWYAEKVGGNQDLSKVRALFGRVEGICGGEAGKQTKTLAWSLRPNAFKGVDDVRLKLDPESSISARLDLVACADLPDRAGPAPKGQAVMLVSAGGQLGVSTEAHLPAGRLAVSGGGSAKGVMRIDYYSLHPMDTMPIAAVADGLRQIGASPFDLAALALQLHSGLKCVVMAGEGSIGLGGEVALASPFSLAQGKLDLARMAYGFNASLSGAFTYHIQADPEGGGKVLLYLQRGQDRSHARQAGIRVGVDLDSTLARIREEALPFLGKADGLLAKADALLLPGESLRDELKQRLGGLDGESGRLLSPLLESLLGFKPGRAPVEALSEALAQRIHDSALDLERHAGAQAGQLLDSLLASLVITPEERDQLQGRLTAELDEALARIQERADARIRSLADSPESANLAQILDQAGLKVQGGLGDVETRVAGLRLVLQRYRQVAGRLVKVLNEATAVKLTASLESTREEKAGASADLVLRFDPLDATARQAFREALLGSFENALDLARGGQAGVEVLDCHLARTVSNRRENQLEVAVLGFVLTSGSMLEVSTDVELGASGNPTLISRGAMEKRRKLMGEKRSLRIADVFEVAAARRTASLKLDITLSHEDDKLQPEELSAFLSSLAAARLLSPTRVGEAVAALELIRANNRNCLHSGRIDVRMGLDGEGLERLMGVGLDQAAYEAGVVDTAVGVLADAYVAKLKRSRIKTDFMLKEVSDYYGLPRDWPGLVRGLTSKVFDQGAPGGGFDFNDERVRYGLEINRMHLVCFELLSALKAMREIYQSDAAVVDHLKDPEYCQARQEAIMLFARSAAPTDFPSLFGKESIDPMTLAAFTLLATLSGRPPDGSDRVEVTMTLCGEDQKQVRRIA